MTLEVSIDTDQCGGYAYCVTSAPAVFDLDDEVKAVVRPSGLAGANLDEVRHAAWECPVRAIAVRVDGHEIELD